VKEGSSPHCARTADGLETSAVVVRRSEIEIFMMDDNALVSFRPPLTDLFFMRGGEGVHSFNSRL
jgi:hypothetical protein